MWPEYVKDRIRTTYMYFGGSILVTAASAMACFRSPLIMGAVMGNSWLVSSQLFIYLIGRCADIHYYVTVCRLCWDPSQQ